MKTRRNKKYWVYADGLVNKYKGVWTRCKYQLPFMPLGLPEVMGKRGRQATRALEVMYRSDFRKHCDRLMLNLLKKMDETLGE